MGRNVTLFGTHIWPIHTRFRRAIAVEIAPPKVLVVYVRPRRPMAAVEIAPYTSAETSQHGGLSGGSLTAVQVPLLVRIRPHRAAATAEATL